MQTRALLYHVLMYILAYQSQFAMCAEFNKKSAYESLKQNGFRWSQTSLLNEDALSKKEQAQAALSPKFGIVSRELLSHTNVQRYGIPQLASVENISYGSTVIEFSYSIVDKIARARLSAANNNQKISDANTRQYRNDLIFLTLLHYINAQKLHEKLITVSENIARDNEILKMAETKVRTGAGIHHDITRAKSLINLENLKRLEVQAGFKKALNDLSTVIGTEKIEGELTRLNVINTDIDKVLAIEIKSERADIESARFAILAAEDLVRMNEAELKPKLTFFGEAGAAGVHVLDTQNTAFTGILGLQLNIPLYSGGYYSAKIQESRVQFEQAKLQQKQLNLEQKMQLDTAIEQLKDSSEAVTLANTQVTNAEEELEIAKKRYDSGAISGLEITNSQSHLSAALDGRVEAAFAYEMAKANYFKVIGNFEPYFALEIVNYK